MTEWPRRLRKTNRPPHGWRVVSSPVRFRTLGEKRNSSAALVSPDVNAYCVWDDDIYLPWHMSAAAAALTNANYTIPTQLYIDKNGHLEPKVNQSLFHGAWSFRREAFERVCGYPFHPERPRPGVAHTVQGDKPASGGPDPVRPPAGLCLPLVHRPLPAHLRDGGRRVREAELAADSDGCSDHAGLGARLVSAHTNRISGLWPSLNHAHCQEICTSR